MSSSSLPTPQIPQDHTQKQLLFHPSSPATTVSWSPPLPSLHQNLLALGHSQGISIYRHVPPSSTTTSTLSRAEVFRKRWTLEHVCDGTIGTPVTKISWAPTSRFMPEGESSITLITLSLDHTARMIEFPSSGGTQSTVLGGTSGHRSFINDVDSIIHPNASTRVSQPPTNEDLVIATVGDDNTLIIWQYTEDAGVVPVAYSLSSRGVAVGFCKHFARRVMVAEEEGTIRVLDWLASDDARVQSSSGGGGTLWLLNIYMGAGLSMGVDGFLASAEWCCEDVDGEGGRLVGVTKGGEWAVWDLSRIEGGGRTIPVERGQVIHASNVVAIRYSPPKQRDNGSGHPSESALFAIASKATHTTPALHIVDLTLEHQTSPHTIQSLPNSTISLTSASWHPTESVLAVTLSSGSLLITRIGERSDGEKVDRPQGTPGDLVITNGFHDEYDEYLEEEEEEEEEERPYDMSFEDSYTSRRGEEMFVDGED